MSAAPEEANIGMDDAGGPTPVDEVELSPRPTPRRPGRRTGLLVAVGAILVVVVLVVALLWGLGLGGLRPSGSSSKAGPPPTEVRVSVVNLGFLPSNNSCFSSPYQSTHAETVLAGGVLTYNVSLSDGNPNTAHSCVVTGLFVNTSGFSLQSSNAPVGVGTGSATLSFTLQTPSLAFNGSVQVYANVTFQGPNIVVTAQNFKVTGGGGECGTVAGSATSFSAFSGSAYSDGALVTDISPVIVCNVTKITLSGTSGFSIGETNLPIQLPIDSFVSVSFELQLPSSAFRGELNFTLTLDT